MGEEGGGGVASVMEGGRELGEVELSNGCSSDSASSSPLLPKESGSPASPPPPPPPSPAGLRGNRVREEGGAMDGEAKARGGVTKPMRRSSSLVSSSLEESSAGGRVTV